MAKPIVLIIRDGWGFSERVKGNAVLAADTPNIDRYRENYPHCMIGTSGPDVGLPKGNQGSSEVGHLNLGAGRIVEQEVVRIDKAIESGEFFKNPLLLSAAQNCRANDSALHLMGLVQDEGVHAQDRHLFSLLQFAKDQGLNKVFVHFFADGRDTPPQSALKYLESLEGKIDTIGVGVIASVMGRFWSMDRDKNWDRIQKAFVALTKGEGLKEASAKAAIEGAYARIEKQKESYASNPDAIIETDEFIRPTLIIDESGDPVGLIKDGDSVIHFNYRQDRAIQLTKAFVEKDFPFFDRTRPSITYVGLTRYYDEFAGAVLPPMNMDRILGEVLCENEIRQLRISETQKFRHVTSFFNSKSTEPFCYEDWILVKSSSTSEDKQPRMKADQVTDLVVAAIQKGIAAVREKALSSEGVTLTASKGGNQDQLNDTYDVIVLNYANCDMVGHRGFFDAAVEAVEAVDEGVGKVVDAVLEKKGIALITADHGNVEQMIDPETGKPHTAHTTFDVEMFYVARNTDGINLVERGVLSDFAPTILHLLGVQKPAQMDRPTLFKE